MSQSLDQLSLEELRSQLAEIQFKIEEKEKQGLIEDIHESLLKKDLLFLRALRQNLVAGNAAPGVEIPAASSLPSAFPAKKKALKSGAYLRNGKVYLGIQEIKYVKYDKNNILRISKEGKGLPPRVDVFPEEIREVLLTLPLRSESTELAEDLPREENLSPLSSPELHEQEASREPEDSSSVEVPPPTPTEEVTMTVDLEPAALPDSPQLEATTTSIDAATSPAFPPRRSRRKVEAAPAPEAFTDKPPRPPAPEPLQVSLF